MLSKLLEFMDKLFKPSTLMIKLIKRLQLIWNN